MSISAADQSFIFICCIACGVIIGILFDIFRIIRQIVPAGTTITFIEDLIFWVITLVVVCYFALTLNYGVIRWYMFASMGIGAVMYFLSLSRIVMLFSMLVIMLIKKVISFIVKILLIPLKLIAKIIKKPLFFVISISKKSIKKLINKLKFNYNTCSKYFKHLKKYETKVK